MIRKRKGEGRFFIVPITENQFKQRTIRGRREGRGDNMVMRKRDKPCVNYKLSNDEINCLLKGL
jgi:hypothetical protein